MPALSDLERGARHQLLRVKFVRRRLFGRLL